MITADMETLSVFHDRSNRNGVGLEGGINMEATERQSTSQTVTCGTARMNTIASMVREAIGDRTMTQFCSDAGLSVGYVSRLLNGRLKSVPSVKTLAKISCVACSGKAAAFFKKLLDASGHSLE